eukprot:363360-Chlamydomonas_euryale.AAC.5
MHACVSAYCMACARACGCGRVRLCSHAHEHAAVVACARAWMGTSMRMLASTRLWSRTRTLACARACGCGRVCACLHAHKHAPAKACSCMHQPNCPHVATLRAPGRKRPFNRICWADLSHRHPGDRPANQPVVPGWNPSIERSLNPTSHASSHATSHSVKKKLEHGLAMPPPLLHLPQVIFSLNPALAYQLPFRARARVASAQT